MGKIEVVRLKVIKESEVEYDLQNFRIASPGDVYRLAKRFYNDIDREMFSIICLDTKNQINCLHTVSIGSLNASIVTPREVFKIAILSNSASILLIHNHPSGDTYPSQEDVEVTKRLVESGKILGITVLDHIIIGDGYTSLKEKLLM